MRARGARRWRAERFRAPRVQGSELAPSCGRTRVGQLQHHDGVHEALLGAVVKIPDHAAPFLVGRRHDARARRGQVRHAWTLEIAVASGSVNSATQNSTWVGSSSSCRVEAMIAPQSLPSTTIGAPTADRMPASRSRVPNSPLARRSRRAGGTSCCQHASADTFALERDAVADYEVRLARRGDDRSRLVAPIAQDRRVLDVEQPFDLLADRCEHLARRCLARHQRRYAAQARCSSAKRSTSVRVSLLAIAVATNSVKCWSRFSVSGGSGSACVAWTNSAPHIRS